MVLVVIGENWYGINLDFLMKDNGECWVEIKMILFVIYLFGKMKIYLYVNIIDDLGSDGEEVEKEYLEFELRCV